MNEIKILLLAYIVVASNGEKEKLKSAKGDDRFHKDAVRSEFKKLAEHWSQNRQTNGKFSYFEAKDGVNEHIIDEVTEPTQPNQSIKYHRLKYVNYDLIKPKTHKHGPNHHAKKHRDDEDDENPLDEETNQYTSPSTKAYDDKSRTKVKITAKTVHKGSTREHSHNQYHTNTIGNDILSKAAREHERFHYTSEESAPYSDEQVHIIANEQASFTTEAGKRLDHLNEHTMVSDDGFGYMVAVLKGARGYMSAGALIDESWILTSADEVYLMRETIRLIRVRLGSVNYKKGGFLLPIKDLEIHPYYKTFRPNYDLALMMLARPVRLTPSIKIIRLQLLPKELTATHLLLTSWTAAERSNETKENETITNNIENQLAKVGKRNPILSVTHLHPLDPEDCSEELMNTGVESAGLMCLETGLKDACLRDSGAPVVVNGVLWGIMSSWISECEEQNPAPVFATKIFSSNVSSWIHSIVHGHNWHVTVN